VASTAGLRGVDGYVRKLVQKHRIPGLALLITKNGRNRFAKGYGFRDVAAQLPVTPRTIFGVASVTKSFTALAVLRLQETGRLKVTDPVVRYLPEFRTPSVRWTKRIRLSHLLTHTSGLPPLPSIYFTSGRSLVRDPPYDNRTARRVGIDPEHPPIDTYSQLLEYLATAQYRMLGPPGTKFSYSNEAFGLLAAVIEGVDGRKYEQFLEEELLRPAGMSATTFDTGIMLRSPEVTTLYSPPRTGGGRGLHASEDWWEDTCLRAAGGLRSNLEDLARYLEIYRTGGRIGSERILSRASVAEMTRPRIEIVPGEWYGYGLFVVPGFPGGPLIHHSGGLKGVSSYFAVLPGRGLTGVALANREGVPSHLAVQAGFNRLTGRPMKAQPAPPPIRPEAPGPLTEYAGWYCSGEGIWFRVRPVRRRLRLDFTGIEMTLKNFQLRSNGADEFVRGPRGGPTAFLRFERDTQGRIWAAFVGWRLVRRRSVRDLPKARTGRMVW